MSVSSLTARVAVRPLVVGLVVLALSGSNAMWDASAREVVMSIDGQRKVVKTHGSLVSDVLKSAGVSVGAHDLLAPAPEVALSPETVIVLRRGRLMNLSVDGVQRDVWVTAMSVSEALSQIGVRADGALLSADRSRAIPLKGFSLEVRTLKQVKIINGLASRKMSTNAVTVGEFLAQNHVAVGPRDVLVPKAATPLRTGHVVRLTRVKAATMVDTVSIGYRTERRASSSMYKGESKVIKAGRAGKLRRTWAVTYVNGREHARKLVATKRLAEPVTKVMSYGTKTRRYSVSGADHLNWWALARCESSNNPRSTGGNGRYRGLYQFTMGTWYSVGGKGDPIDASPGEQTYRAKLLYKQRGSSPWPTCGKYLYS